MEKSARIEFDAAGAQYLSVVVDDEMLEYAMREMPMTARVAGQDVPVIITPKSMEPGLR